MTTRIVTVSYSELATYRRCPLLWDIQYRQRWRKEPGPDSPRALGTTWHEVLRTHYQAIRDGGDPIGAVSPLLYDGHGTQTEQQALIEWVYEGYVGLYGTDPKWTVAALEHRFVVPLLDERGRKTRFRLKGFIDAVMRDRATGGLWIWDHKLIGRQFPSEGDLELDDQFGLYTWAMRQLGKPIMGSLHNAARREKLKTRELDLDDRFKRTRVYRNETELTNLAFDAYRAAKQAHSAQSQELIYSSPNPFNCRGCDLRNAHLEARRGARLAELLASYGFTQDGERH